MKFMSSLSLSKISEDLHKGGESSTFERLSSSRHLADLRLIFLVTVMIMFTALILSVILYFTGLVTAAAAFVGAILTVGGGTLAWTYQTGSARLGVVDLFACEIKTLCAVVVVADVVKRYTDLFSDGPRLVKPHHVHGVICPISVAA